MRLRSRRTQASSPGHLTSSDPVAHPQRVPGRRAFCEAETGPRRGGIHKGSGCGGREGGERRHALWSKSARTARTPPHGLRTGLFAYGASPSTRRSCSRARFDKRRRFDRVRARRGSVADGPSTDRFAAPSAKPACSVDVGTSEATTRHPESPNGCVRRQSVGLGNCQNKIYSFQSPVGAPTSRHDVL